ncbi:cpr-6 [Symbiodinium natans]|uniref:Cpr-6 protein n=1 Tax=Symbiodinium natans TaxID=878477 RepID=A0A812QNU5_9DINO|nr:cpr-6 [Symbiodinium natans]
MFENSWQDVSQFAMVRVPRSRRKSWAETCIATVCGKRCGQEAWAANVPYCEEHAGHGDPSCAVAEIPTVGKILVAARPLPKGYRLAWWGRRCRKAEAKDLSRCFELSRGWVIDPTDHPGSLLQYCAAPGPSEASTLACTRKVLATTRASFGSWLFTTRHSISEGEQLLMPYSKPFFKERDLPWVNVGTAAHPARRRKGLPVGTLPAKRGPPLQAQKQPVQDGASGSQRKPSSLLKRPVPKFSTWAACLKGCCKSFSVR